MRAKRAIEALLQPADIRINGKRPWDIQVHNEELYSRVLRQGSLGLGEAYVDGWWDAVELDRFFVRVLSAKLERRVFLNITTLRHILTARLMNLSRLRPFQVGQEPYDIGNELYQAMLGSTLAYTCAYWKDAKSLDEAQEAKLDLVCQKIGLKRGHRVLDIGSGWGSFINFAARHYGVKCVGVTVSQEQAAYANTHRDNLPVATHLQDFLQMEEMEGKFDRIVSLGMFEHVGYKNYRAYMKKVRSLLCDDGLFLLHTIGSDRPSVATDPWIAKYIFPNSMLPSRNQITQAAGGFLVLEDWHNFNHYHYDITLMHWWRNFDASWPELLTRYNERFYRVWKYYLMASAASFRVRSNLLWQIVFSKNGIPEEYISIR